MNRTSIKMAAVRVLVLSTLMTTGFMVQPVLADEKEAAVTVPNTPSEIWQAIDSQVDETTKLIQAGTLKELHHHAFAIRDLVAGLPAHSASLPADKLAKVKSDGKFVATIAERLDTAGDSNDKAAAETNFGKLKNILATLRANYPDIKASSASIEVNTGK